MPFPETPATKDQPVKRAKAPAQMTDEAILARITPALEKAIDTSENEIGSKHASGMRLYLADPFKGDDKLVGRSTYVSGIARNSVNLATASLLRLFDSTAQVVQYQPRTADDEALATQMTAVVNYVAREANSHCLYLSEWFRSGLITGLGILTADVERDTGWAPPQTIPVPDMELAALLEAEEAGEIRILETGEPTIIPPPSPELPPVEVREIKLRRMRNGQARIAIEAIPVDRFVVSADASFDQSTGGINAALQGYWRVLPRHKLIEMGFDSKLVASIASENEDDSELSDIRSRLTGSDDGVGDTHDDVRVWEIFVHLDVDKDGYAELVRLTIGGEPGKRAVILHRQEVTCAPFAAFSPNAVPNSLFGVGMTHTIEAETRLTSQLKRAVIDNLNLSNYPIRVANEESINFDDLLSPHADKIIRSKGDPTGGISYVTPPNVAGQSYQYLAMLSADVEDATGVGRGMMGLDASGLKVETATGAEQRASGAQLLVEGMARQIAETGYRYLFRVITGLLLDNPDDAAAMTARLTNGFVPMATDGWDPSLDLQPNIAFGQTNKASTLASLQMIMGLQQQAMAAGMSDPAKLFQTASLILEASGYKNAERFFTDPAKLPPQPPQEPQPDPAMMKAQAEIEMMQQKAQFEAQIAQMKAQADIDLARMKAEADIAMKREAARQDFQLRAIELQAESAIGAMRDPSAPNLRFPD